MIPFAKINERVMNSVEPKYSCVIGKRIMLRMSEMLAAEVKAAALVTGDNVGQVASQTLSNIRTEDDSVGISVFRPVLGMNKQEIIDLAKAIGTYEISEKIKTSCPLTSRSPATRTNADNIKETEKMIRGLGKVMKEALAERETIRI